MQLVQSNRAFHIPEGAAHQDFKLRVLSDVGIKGTSYPVGTFIPAEEVTTNEEEGMILCGQAEWVPVIPSAWNLRVLSDVEINGVTYSTGTLIPADQLPADDHDRVTLFIHAEWVPAAE